MPCCDAMDEALLSKIRLSIISELLTNAWVSFPELLVATGATNGNLNTHLAKLVACRYVTEHKTISGRRPLTQYRITDAGRRAFFSHLEELQRIARSATRHS